MDPTITASSRRIDEFVRRYSGRLITDLDMSDLDVKVFFYLFDNKVYGPKPAHSAYETFKSLQSNRAANGMAKVFDGAGKKISPKKVTESLGNLVTMGFAKVISDGSKKRGRPAKGLYELKSMHEVTRLIDNKIEERRGSIHGVLDELWQVEEQPGVRELDEKSQ